MPPRSARPLGDLNMNTLATPQEQTVEPANTATKDKNAVAAPKKRKRDAAPEHEPLPEIDDDDPRLDQFTDTPQQTRRKIQCFIDGGHTGRRGEFSDAYQLAARFFRKRELQGLKAVPPSVKKAKTTAAGDKKTTGKKAADDYLDVSDVSIPGEENTAVPVYDTCDEVRKKIRAAVRSGVTQAALCQGITNHCLPEGYDVGSRQMTAFLAKKGPLEGNTSIVFYGSYVFFEKRRLKDGKPKSEFRLEMERTMAKAAWCKPGEYPYVGKHGVFQIVGRG
ncbi:hypothetical protein F5Y17DRAFT_460452 [Xylariaceae sp. FL0594]|nr:hypothetical protein F5Y17DRAFT_460452 [Xylariaceae sp. FL0594]